MKLAALVSVTLLAGCALTSKATPVDVRYFSPEPLQRASRPRAQLPERPIRVGLGRISSSAHLRNRIVYRASAFELGTYEDWRWTEYPEQYLRRSLTQALFDQHPAMVQATTPRAPTVDVELIAFEEVRRKATRSGRVQIAYRLRDDREVLASGVITVERQAAGPDGIAPVVESLGEALGEATATLADRVEAKLAEREGRSVSR